MNIFGWAVCSILAAAILYTWVLDHTRDVPPEYLNEQSVVDSTRLPQELAIYKSPKLDYSSGLRVGLGIRYDHYKLRNGNLCDVWEIMLRCLRADPDRTITVGSVAVPVAELNFNAHEVAKYLETTNEKEVNVPLNLFISSPQVLAVVIACFVSQITVHVYDGDSPSGMLIEEADDGLQFCNGDKITPFSEVVGPLRRKTDFVNEYTPAKDHGIAMRVSMRLNVQVSACTDFTQTNLVSAAASCIKHLPPQLALSASDRLVVVQVHDTPEAVMNSVVKMIAAFVSHAEVVLAPHNADYAVYHPTVLSLPAVRATELAPTAPTNVLLASILYWHRRYALRRLHFSRIGTQNTLRLVYAHRTLGTGTLTSWNGMRAALGVHVVEEGGYFNVAGPVVVSDVYDYRVLPTGVAAKVSSWGSIVQADEAKLIGYDGKAPGTLCVRGYNIGKATTTMAHVGQKNVRPDKDGFYTLPVEARWGTDGCLYVMTS